MMRHGPHHAAQKSTTTGSSVPATKVSKFSSVSSIGAAESRALPQRPHTGSSPSRSSGTRLVERQWGQARCMANSEVDFISAHAARRADFNLTLRAVWT